MKLRYSLLLLIVFLYGSMLAQPMSVRDRIRFISQPPLTGQKGVAYNYTAQAVSFDSSTVYYYSDRLNPKGFTIDSISGVVSWTPAARGWYNLSIVAKSDKSVGIQTFIVMVTGGNGIVTGRITDTTGSVPIPNVIVEVLQASNPGPIASPGLIVPGYYMYSGKTDANGYYRISHIDPGNYKLHAISPTPQYLSEWYDGKTNPTDATVIQIADTPQVTSANFRLRSGITRTQKITVSGFVTDTNFSPIKNSLVYFVRYGFALNSNNTVDDFQDYFTLDAPQQDCRITGPSVFVYKATIDSTGKYSIQIPQGSYIAFAEAHGYATEYYLGQSDILSATQLILQSDTTGINFALSPLPPVAFGTISGSVIDSTNNIGVQARVILTRDRWALPEHFKIARSYVVDTDSLGAFSADSLLPGSYFVFALPLGKYAPAFYSTDTNSTQWKKATEIAVNGNDISGINIYVHQIPIYTNGYAGINGFIRTQGASSTGIPGAVVYASTNNQIAGYAISTTAGAYTIDGLAPGSYSVSVDNLGSNETSSVGVSLSYDAKGNPAAGTANFSLEQTATEVSQGTTALQPTSFALGQNYPNPFNPSTTIHYALAASGTISLKVYNILGQEVATLVNGYQKSGNYQVVFNGQGLASGIYLYRLHSQSSSITKKMILLQ